MADAELEEARKKATKPLEAKRTSFVHGSDAYGLLSEAICRWNGNADVMGKKNLTSFSKFSKEYVSRGLKKETLRKYLNGNKVLAIKETRGRPALIQRESQEVIADSIASADHGNRGVSRRTAVNLI